MAVETFTRDLSRAVVNFADVTAEPDDIGIMHNRLKPSMTLKPPSAEDTPAPMNPGARTVTFMPSQVGAPDQVSIAYTATPLRLLWYDLQLVLSKLPATTGILRPWRVGRNADPYDELYPSGTNLWCIALHTILIFTQLFFLFTLPWHVFSPIGAFLCYIAFFMFFNTILCMMLNGTELKLLPTTNVDPGNKFGDEYWLYLNGVSVGKSWLQGNVDRLSLTFGRNVVGVHNTTSGIIFDLLQCLLQRNFAYNTQDVREAYACIKEALLDPSIKKVVFILHSQGGIEGSLILDWLFAEIPRDALKRMEVYTFGNAANHFNNPDLFDPASQYGRKQLADAEKREEADPTSKVRTKVLGHIEHYANAGDFVSQFGVLNYTRINNRFMGRLFLSPGSGHLLNQHYLYKMFALTPDRKACADTNPFMEMEVRLNKHDISGREDLEKSMEDRAAGDVVAFVGDVNAPVKPVTLLRSGEGARRLQVKDFSRLWLYRNGESPED